MSLPDKGMEGHICPTIVISWWRHCNITLDRHELGGAKILLHCGQGGGMSS